MFLPGKFHGQRSLVGYSPWGHKELDTTEGLTLSLWPSLVAQMVKSLPMQETLEMQVQSLGWEDPLEKGMAIHSSIPVWRIPWAESLAGYIVHGVTKSRT